MSQGRIVSIHSYRGGTGKSNLTANIAACLLDAGRRVAVLDSDLASPGVHVLFGMKPAEITLSLVDFLWDRCTIRETAYDVTGRVGGNGGGRLWLIPASLSAEAITRVIEEGYDVQRLSAHLDRLLEELELDTLLIDTHPGLNRETMLTSALSDTLVLVVRPDQQDYDGTAVLLEIARRLEVPRLCLLANKVLGAEGLAKRLQEAFAAPVVGQIPLSEELARLESRRLLVRASPDHEISHTLRAIADRITAP